jgi:hypothetical protein
MPNRICFDRRSSFYVCRFEGSALALLQGKAWVAFDNMFALARLPADLDSSSSSSNSNGADEPVLIGRPASASQFEVKLTATAGLHQQTSVAEVNSIFICFPAMINQAGW